MTAPPRRHRRKRWRSSGQPRKSAFDRQLLALAGGPALQFHHPLFEPARAEDQLPGQADQVHGRELGAAALVAVVVERLDSGLAQTAVNLVGGARASAVVRAHVDQADPKRRYRLGPDDAGLVVARLDDRAGEPRDADSIASHLRM